MKKKLEFFEICNRIPEGQQSSIEVERQSTQRKLSANQIGSEYNADACSTGLVLGSAYGKDHFSETRTAELQPCRSAEKVADEQISSPNWMQLEHGAGAGAGAGDSDAVIKNLKDNSRLAPHAVSQPKSLIEFSVTSLTIASPERPRAHITGTVYLYALNSDRYVYFGKSNKTKLLHRLAIEKS